MTYPDWQALALDIVLHSDERWQDHRDRIAQALNQAWSDGRRYQAQASTRESDRRPARMPEEGWNPTEGF